MPDAACLFLSVCLVVAGLTLLLFPQVMLHVSRSLNRTLMVLDDQLVRHHRLVGVLLFIVGYGVFQLALLLPTLGQ